MLKKMGKGVENPCCQDCWKWKKFGKDCYAHWDFKKVCTLKEEIEGEMI